MRDFFRHLNAPCRDITALISASQDRDLPRSTRMAIRLHLLYCTACRRFSKQVKLIRAALGALGRESESQPETSGAPTLSSEARQRLRDSISSE